MKRTLVLLLVLGALAPLRAALPAPAFTGKELARAAALYERARQEGRFRNEQEEREVNYFVGYVEGAALASRKICVPSTRGVRDQLGDATAKYLRQHPREWHLPPDTLVVKAVQPVFPCSRTPAPKR
jgi:Rap1a immunity proteins